MEYGRTEMLLGRGGWSRGMWVIGAVGGQIRGVAIDPSNLAVTQTMIPRKRVSELAAQAITPVEPTGALPFDGIIRLSANAPVRGPGGALGSLSRLWVGRSSGRITHVLFCAGTLWSHGRLERIVPADLVESIDRAGVTVRLEPRAAAELPIFRSDALVAADVQRALDGTLTNPRARRGVKVHVDDGHVTLAGEVDTVEQVYLAQRAAATVAGIRSMTVDLAAQEALAAAVEERIASIVAVSANGHGPVRVLAEHGIVYLEGGVTSLQASKEIERAALAAAGARVVVNNLYVNGEPPGHGLGTGPLVRNR